MAGSSKLSISRRGDKKAEPPATDPISAYTDELIHSLSTSPFVVFLCGPSLKKKKNPGTRVRRLIMTRLKREGIEVVLGEDDGLEDARLRFHINAQDNELEFISRSCNSIIIVAGSVGSFCELGLFSWHYAHNDGLIRQSGDKDFILLVEKKHRNTRKKKSYLNEGPGRAVHGFGLVSYIDFAKSDISAEIDEVVHRVLERRATFRLDQRGRPLKRRSSMVQP